MSQIASRTNLVMLVENPLHAKLVRRVTRSLPDHWFDIRTTLRSCANPPDMRVSVVLHEDAPYDTSVPRSLADCGHCITSLHLTRVDGFFDTTPRLFAILAGMPALQHLNLEPSSIFDVEEQEMATLQRPTFRLRSLVLACSFRPWLLLIVHSADTLVDLTLGLQEHHTFYELAEDENGDELLQSCLRSLRHLRFSRESPDADIIRTCHNLRSLAIPYGDFEQHSEVVQALQRPLTHLTLEVYYIDEEFITDILLFIGALAVSLQVLQLGVGSWEQDDEVQERAYDRLCRWCAQQRIQVSYEVQL
ncbi:hypothetical protein EXIGLDRAFT_844991 [Exidia glandulosa HHB12029]|uniref:F-box domain-containing protein n=1 Tax=Exidia glandulosa HHB12029 TaxID=1314781 RepID=A0A165BQF7_EXIGL|nr:hypothetical protein EXIGLDRAFT_844991 [Exidia glandulosa HHB12029]